jgi:hypothetical protein
VNVTRPLWTVTFTKQNVLLTPTIVMLQHSPYPKRAMIRLPRLLAIQAVAIQTATVITIPPRRRAIQEVVTAGLMTVEVGTN